MAVDTSRDAVERLALRMEGIARQTTVYASLDRAHAGDAAVTLRALRAALTQAEAERDQARTALRDLVWSVWIDHPSTQDIINMDAFDRARAALGDSA